MKPANQRFAGRYRPPGPKRSPLITPEGAAALKDELDDLWRNKRPVITLAVQEAAALGIVQKMPNTFMAKKCSARWTAAFFTYKDALIISRW